MNKINISIITSLYRCAPFLKSFLFHYSQISNLEECELILVHNDPTEEEMEILKNGLQSTMQVVHIAVEREGLYASWNRAIRAAKGKYLAVWNVDDIRTPDSLYGQKMALDNSRAVMCYGDFYGTNQYGAFKETLYAYPDYATGIREAYKRHIIGCFPMWRRDIHEHIGYFDEQFKLVSDYEFQLRVIRRYPLVKTPVLLGYYLEHAGHKLSSNRKVQHRERTAVEFRYHMYDKILMHYLPAIRRYRPKYILNHKKWISLTEVIPKARTATLKETLLLLGMPFFYGSWFIKRSFHVMYNNLFQ
jgi:GT2 family glycosyltransferase